MRLNAASAALAVLSLLSLGAAGGSTTPPGRGLPAAPPSASERLRAQSLLHPDGAAMLRVLGAHARETFSPRGGRVGALIAVPPGESAESLGARWVAPGIARVDGSPAALVAFADAHPGVHMEVAPPLRLNMRTARRTIGADLAFREGADGAGVLVGVADTGIDISHPSFLDENGASRVAWLLDLSREPMGIHPELEARFGIKNDAGELIYGAVLNHEDIDALLARDEGVGYDPVGHGTHVASLAAGGAVGGAAEYRGVAPRAGLVIAGLSRAGNEAIGNDDLIRGVEFMFDRADFEGRPVAVNLSLGGDFGPHDGSMLWEQALASFVGEDHPGRVLVAAAGNSGSVADKPVHQSVRVTAGTRTRVPVVTRGAANGGVQIWVTLREGADLKIGLEATDEEWIPPIEEGTQRGKNAGRYNAGVIFGSGVAGSPVPPGSRGAVVLWSGLWPAGTYYVTLEGDGMADLYIQGTGDVATTHPAAFAAGVREGTINLPGTHPAILSVGCTVNVPKWVSIAGGQVGLNLPVLDDEGGMLDPSRGRREPIEGEICWFSGAGPTVTGVPKPEISAPGAAVIGAMSRAARPGSSMSIFTTEACPPLRRDSMERDERCFQIDEEHAVALGTSMSAPMVTGAAALLLQRDPTLTQAKVTSLLQAGAHRFRRDPPFEDQGGPGELDILGAFDALEQLRTPAAYLPSARTSWIALSADYGTADGSTPLTAILELRTADGAHRADVFDEARLQARALLDGEPLPAPVLARRGPGLWSFTVAVPRGRGGATLTLGATFDGEDVVTPKSVPVATDPWNARYAPSATGGCAVSPSAEPPRAASPGVVVAALLVSLLCARRRRDAGG